jgi:hypothetical protein
MKRSSDAGGNERQHGQDATPRQKLSGPGDAALLCAWRTPFWTCDEGPASGHPLGPDGKLAGKWTPARPDGSFYLSMV